MNMNMNMKVVYYFISLRRTSLRDKSLPYVKRLYSVTPYWPSRVTVKVGFSCYWKTTLDGLVSSGHILYKRAHYELYTYRCCVAQTAHDPWKVSLALMSYRNMRIGLCHHSLIQSDTAPFHIVNGQVPYSSLQSTHAWPLFTRTG